MFGWFWSLLKFLGFVSQLDGKIVFLGLDNAGKTTLLYKLKNDRIISPEPTPRVNQEEVQIGSANLTAIDVGGHILARKLWEQYYLDVKCIVFIVDTTDKARFEEARVELNRVLTDEKITKVPVCVLGNKIDKPNSISEGDCQQVLGLTGTRTGKSQIPRHKLLQQRPLELFMVSVLEGHNLNEALDWIQYYSSN